jgi:hypothetical protein
VYLDETLQSISYADVIEGSAKICDDLAPTFLIETFQNTVFGLCWAVSTVNLDLYATTVSEDYITACSGRIAIGTSTTWDW